MPLNREARGNSEGAPWLYLVSKPIRYDILGLLKASRKLSFSVMRRKLEASYGALNPNSFCHHLKMLEKGGLISREHTGRGGTAGAYSFYALTETGRQAFDATPRRPREEDYRPPQAMAGDEPIKIGMLHSLTGTMSMSEQPLVLAARMAVDEINDKGGLLGRQLMPIIEDGNSDWPTFAWKARKLVEDDKVASVFGCWTSASRKEVLPVIETNKSLLWYPVQYEGYENSRNCFYTGATVNQQILPAVDWCLEEGWNRAFLVGSNYIFPRTANKIIKMHLRKKGAKWLGEKYVDLGNWHFNKILKAIKRTRPDVIFNTVNGDSNIALFRQLHEERIGPDEIPVFSFSIAEVELRHIGTRFTTGHYCGWNYFQSIDTPENRRFVRAFKRRYGSEQVTDDPIEAAYFQVHLFAESVKKAGSTAIDAIRTAARGLEYMAPGGLVRVDPQNQHIWSEARIGKIRPDGQFDIVWNSDGLVPPNPYPYKL